MGQPTPPGDLPLFDGLGSEWNDIVGAFPEDKRGELAPKLKERIAQYEPLKGYADFHKSGITPDKVGTALNLQQFIENNPQQAYEAIGNFLGITPQQAQQAVEEENGNGQESSPEADALLNDPRYKTLQEQVQTLMQVTVMKDQQERQSKAAQEADASLDKELADLRKKHGDFPEREIVMRMANNDMTAEEALADFTQLADSLRRRPAPFLMGNGGQVPRNNIDPTKLTPKDTRALAAQMMQQAMNEANQ